MHRSAGSRIAVCDRLADGGLFGHSGAAMSNPAHANDRIVPDGDAAIEPRSQRFADKHAAIVAAATLLINRHGIAGTTFGEVAQMVGLNTASATYYFRRKEHLVQAVFADSIRRLGAMATRAAAEPDPPRRVQHYLHGYFDLNAEALRGGTPIATLSELRSLDAPVRIPLEQAYQQVFRQVRGFFGPIRDDPHRRLLTVRAFVLEQTMFWLPTWLPRYSIGDFDRVRARLFEILARGIVAPDQRWTPASRPAESDGSGEVGRATFLRAATRLINSRGYRGASVDRIASELGVTKGSFYHHLETKDDLVLACFRESYARIADAHRWAQALDGGEWHRLSSAIAALLDIQFTGERPLLRTAALQTLPADLRADVVERSNRIALSIAGTLVDGIREGSIRPIDPSIASQILVAALNAAQEMQGWGAHHRRDEAIAIYASVMLRGLFAS